MYVMTNDNGSKGINNDDSPKAVLNDAGLKDIINDNSSNDMQNYDCSHDILKKVELNTSPPVSNYITYEPALANWNRWLRIHEKQQNKLCYQVNRHPQCLVMNSSLNNTYVNQEKTIISDANNITFCDKYRGHPHFWITDESTKNNGTSLGVYQPIHKRYDRSCLESEQQHCFMPEQREYIGVPKAVLKEKGISENPCLPTPQVIWDKSVYVTKKREFLTEKLKLVQEHKPNISSLAIVGIAPSQAYRIDGSNISLEKALNNICTCSTSNSDTIQKPISVMIGEKEINESDESWSVYFENCEVNKQYDIYITITNLNKVCLRYSWSLELPQWVNSDLPVKYLKNQGKCFYFDKNDGVILPGCERKVKVYFRSSRVGVFRESWKIHLSNEPDQWKAKIIELLAVVTEKLDCTMYTEAIDSYLESCTRYTIARKAVEEIFEKSRLQRQELPYERKFFEEQIFSHNNPDLFYDNKCVNKLKNLHSKISAGPWDYSVNNLRRVLLEKSLNEDCSQELEVFSSTIYQLIKPNLPCHLLNQKEKSVYELLRCFVSKIDHEGNNLTLLQNLSVCVSYSEASSHHGTQIQNTFKRSTKSSLSRKSLSKYSIIKNITDHTDDIGSISKPHSCDSDCSIKIKTRKQDFLEVMYIKTYHHLSQTIDQISAIIDSFDAQRKQTILKALRDRAA